MLPTHPSAGPFTNHPRNTVAGERCRVIRNRFGILANQETVGGAKKASTVVFTNRAVISKATNKDDDVKKEDGDVKPTPTKKRGLKPATATTSTTPRSSIGKKRTAATVDPSIGNGLADDSEQQESPTKKAKATGKAPTPNKFVIIKKEEGGGALLSLSSSFSELPSVPDIPAPAKIITVKKEKGGGAPLAPPSPSSELSSVPTMTAAAKPVLIKKEKGDGETLAPLSSSSKLSSAPGMTTDEASADEMEE